MKRHEEPRPLAPPHIMWPLFVVGLLLIGIGSAVAVLLAAGSGGGVEVVHDYYRKAASWDSTALRKQASLALGWKTRLEVDAAAGAALRSIRVYIVDRDDQPVSGLQGTVALKRPQQANPFVQLPMTAQTEAGWYTIQAPLTGAGLWDFDIEATRDTALYLVRIRKDVP